MAIVNITTVSDADFVRAFQYKTLDGAGGSIPFDLTGARLRMGIRRHAADYEELLLLTTENGGILINDAPNGIFTVTIRKETLLDLPVGDYQHSLIRIMAFPDQAFLYRLWTGSLVHSAGPSR